MKNYCRDDFIFNEELRQNYFKAKEKNGSDFYYIKKYTNINLDNKKIEVVKQIMTDLSEITKLKLIGLFVEEREKEKDLYLIFEYFEGILVSGNYEIYNYEAWYIAKNVLEIFEKLSEKGIKFPKIKDAIDVFEINLYEVKINIFNLICNDFEEKDEKEDNSGILFSLGILLETLLAKDNYIFKGLIKDLKNSKIDIPTSKKLFNLFSRYSINYDNTNDEIIDYEGYIYSGSLKNNKPDGKGILLNELGKIYEGEFKDGKINGKGKSFIYDKNIRNAKKKIDSYSGDSFLFGYRRKKVKTDNALKIYEGTFDSLIKNGKYIEYNENHNKTFEGEFKNDKKNGQGVIYNNDGNKIFEGELKDDKREGKGIEYKNGGIIYKGDFQNDYYHGKGILFYDNGKKQYEGDFNNGFFSGDGVYYDISGEKTTVSYGLPLLQKFPNKFLIYYSSGKIHYKISLKSLKDCILNGKEYNSDEKLEYSGDFKTYFIIGKEKEKMNLENFRSYENYSCIFKHGYGSIYNWNETLHYKGEFRFNNYNGEGKLYDYNWEKSSFIKYDGFFQNGDYHGKGTEYFKESKNKKYVGSFKNGTYNGEGIQYNNNGNEKYNGIFIDGYLVKGFQNTEDYNGQINNGKKEGKGKVYIDNKLRFDGLFKNGLFLEGTLYNMNKKKFFEGKVSEDNKIEGKFYGYDKSFEGKFEDFCKEADYII